MNVRIVSNHCVAWKMLIELNNCPTYQSILVYYNILHHFFLNRFFWQGAFYGRNRLLTLFCIVHLHIHGSAQPCCAACVGRIHYAWLCRYTMKIVACFVVQIRYLHINICPHSRRKKWSEIYKQIFAYS